MQATLPLELARELKSFGFTQSPSADAVYALSEHLRISRKDALQMWYGSKRKAGLPLELEEEAVFTPTLSASQPLAESPYNWPATKRAIGRHRRSFLSDNLLERERRRTNRWRVCGF
jgi:hypothetical protein